MTAPLVNTCNPTSDLCNLRNYKRPAPLVDTCNPTSDLCNPRNYKRSAEEFPKAMSYASIDVEMLKDRLISGQLAYDSQEDALRWVWKGGVDEVWAGVSPPTHSPLKLTVSRWLKSHAFL